MDQATNYGVVRLSLLEYLYERLYAQRLNTPDESTWPCQILPNRIVTSASQTENSGISLKLGLPGLDGVMEELEVDYVFTATGYKRDAHEEMLAGITNLLPSSGKIAVERNYRVIFGDRKVHPSAGIWLQGCNEETHGVSLSIY